MLYDYSIFLTINFITTLHNVLPWCDITFSKLLPRIKSYETKISENSLSAYTGAPVVKNIPMCSYLCSLLCDRDLKLW